ncbi:DNA-directed RNA polymerases I and III, 40 kDa polypeptide, putative [Theileria annulata]|uniref:DNA-directed RNA polymerases I and III, 40 kDa polypeptide, putative n=1 Tax=Theileria annulata TaxID=5874 RepID=Q4UFV7_THEAN|nr:DNA-directed RNA polymerases I and III, 40 kDa polypeptide, putative [Theileria annulata]CAI74224.1 DNA-directed RNA polymerases I and III, 40 kDa polypeptide, putative [Theileria annulata]|eukprot:XP_951956.1 DNA-directed RNA polymerases I and III, 40 kDa polypeptide, putative [Theileria annulata]
MPNRVFLEPSGIKPCYEESDGDNIPILEKVKNLQIKFLKKTPEFSVVEIAGLDVSFANALRRILISEVPTLAVETVQIYQNTGVVQDELLAHRLGLIPFSIDPDLFNFKSSSKNNHCFADCEEINDKNSVCFKLKVKYNKFDQSEYLSIYSNDLKWVPLSNNQEIMFKDNPPKPVYGDILITKLGPGQEIDLNMYLEKGIGKVHSKWSPVSTAVYKFMPKIVYNVDILLEFSADHKLTATEKKNLPKICPMNVFSYSKGEVNIENPLNCTSCRRCLELYPKKIIISKLTNHIICTFQYFNHFSVSIESSGSVTSYDLLLVSLYDSCSNR